MTSGDKKASTIYPAEVAYYHTQEVCRGKRITRQLSALSACLYQSDTTMIVSGILAGQYNTDNRLNIAVLKFFKGVAVLPRTAEILLNGQDVEAVKLPEAQISLSPDLKLTYGRKRWKAVGNLSIPKATVKLPEIPETAVKVSNDAIIAGKQLPEQGTKSPVMVDADIEVELGKQIRFSGQGLETGLTGKLQIAKTGDVLAARGQIDMQSARYEGYGQKLNVHKGRFIFSGPPDNPWLDVEAVRISKDQKVTAVPGLSGPFDTPQTRIYAEPSLPEAEALAYLVTGGPLNQVSKAEGYMVASAALSYGAGQVSWLANKLGIDEFHIKEGKTLQDTLLAVGEYLTPDFYVGTKLGLFNNQAVVVLKHKLIN